MSRSLLCLVLAVFAVVPNSRAQAAVIDVYVYSFEFSINPEGQPVVDPVITVGDTIQWIWQEGNHTTTSVVGSIEQWNADIDSGSPTFQHTFTNTGTFWYYCIPHGFDNGDGTSGGMAGTVTVLAPGTGACCLSNGTCVETSPANCLQQGGDYQGDNSTCTPNPCANQPVTVTLIADADGILYESGAGDVANGAGQQLYAGNQSNGLRRRIVVHFDVSAIPAGATIQSALLRLYCNQNNGVAFNVTAHRLNADWGEGTSDDSGNEGDGTAAATNDATWFHRFYNTVLWTTPGGDFATTPSATQAVGAPLVFHEWTSAALVADVQGWVDLPGSNFGWIVRGDEASPNNTKRFDSRQSGTSANWPQLEITYLPVGVMGACCLNDGTCVEGTSSQCTAQGGIWQGANTMCSMVSCPIQLTPYLDALPLPAVAQPTTGIPGGEAHYDITILELFQQLHSQLPPTRVWGYAGSYPGPTIEARHGLPVTVTWTNDIRVFETQQLRTEHVLPVHTCMHGPDIWGLVPMTVTHLHGGLVTQQSDGYPEWAFPPGQSSPVYEYPNNQPAATIWYHDHALGITRLNVVMGLAGFYLIRDDLEDALNIPRGEYEIAMAIQDRSFNADGSLKYPEIMMDHVFGDVLLVNGKVWPYLNVKQGKYRFRIVDGSTSRAYRLSLSNGATFWQIGSDTGLLPAPVAMTQVLVTPGERLDLVMDFAPYAAGTEIILTNDAPAPYPGSPGVGVIPNVMKFIVQDQVGDTDRLPANLAPVEPIPSALSVKERTQELRVIADTQCQDNPHGMWTLDGLMWDDITEFPRLGATEIWGWKNRSSMTHPMHMHLVSVQVLDRQEFDTVTGIPFGPLYPPAANEIGWKDTVQSPPGFVTRVITRFDGYEGLYPYHCHIIDHEDHEMMRQFEVRPACSADIAPAGNVNDAVNVEDLLALISAWGACLDCLADINHDNLVNVDDLLTLISGWGACP
ncbi:MAG: DNRLRE domain-containing protein [Phycisphaerales bacterium]|nr:DNRLRE domain-containing protein [Phycisphaerales bacterium]